MVKIVTLFKVRQDKTVEECHHYWKTTHTDIVKKHLPKVKRYVINPQLPIKSREWPFDGVSELWFDSVDDVKEAFKTEGANIVREDEKHFTSHVVWMLVEETEVIPFPNA